MDPFTGLLVCTVTVFAPFPLLRKLLKKDDMLTVVLTSFILGLSFIILPLTVVGITLQNGFGLVSWVIFFASIVLFASTSAIYFKPLRSNRAINIRLTFKRLSLLDYALIAVIIFLAFKYLYMLSLKGIIDSDATGLYLTFGRRISIVDHIPLVNYDYQPNVYPLGISVLYAWLHSIGGSPYDESFRLLPFLSVIITILLIYKITTSFSTARIAKIAVIIYALLPIQDTILHYCSYYPDPFYYALILATFFFMFSYLRKLDAKYCFFGGLSFGLAALFKPQFFLVIPATVFVFICLLKNKKLKIISTAAFSLTVGLFYLYFVWGDPSFFFNLSLEAQVVSMSFVFILTAILAFVITKFENISSDVISSKRLIRDFFIFCGTFAGACVFWYLRNFVLTGSIMWTTSFRDANYQWALNFLNFTSSSIPQGNIFLFVLLLVSIPFTVYVLGTLWLSTKFFGLIDYLRHKNLIFIVWITGYWTSYFWWSFYHFETYSLNPRDLFFFFPFFAIFSAIGISAIINFSTRRYRDVLVLYLISAFGFLSLAQSLLISNYGPAVVKNSLDVIARLFGSSLTILSWQTGSDQISLLSSTLSLLIFTSVISLIVLSPFLLNFVMRLIKPNLKIRVKLKTRFKLKFSDKMPFKVVVVFILMFTIMVAPYILLTYEFGGGNIQNFGKAQLDSQWGGLYTQVASYLNSNINNGEVIFTSSSAYKPLQYFIQKNVSVIALDMPGNLAVLRSIIESNSSSFIASSLKQLNVRYFLEWKGQTTPFINKIANSLFFEVLHDPRYFVVVQSFGPWNLYEFIYGK